MSISVDEDLYKWMNSLNVNLQEGKKVGQNKFELSKATVTYLENGISFAKLAMQLSKLNNQPLDTSLMEQMKDQNTPNIKLQNWNILTEMYKKIYFNIDPDIKSLIVAGDKDMIIDLLREIYMQIGGGLEQSKLNDISIISKNQSMKNISNVSNLDINKIRKKQINETIDISKVDVNKDLNKSNNMLEFLIIALGKHFQLKSKQAASLFTNNNKYLAHVIAKGIKNEFQPIISFYQDIYQHTDQIILLLQRSENDQAFTFALNALKPGFISKSIEVAEWCARLFITLGYLFQQNNMYNRAWQWFIQENGGLHSCLLGLRRHPVNRDLIVDVLLQFGKYNFSELFTQQLKKQIQDPKDLLFAIIQMLRPLLDNQITKDQVLNSGVLDDWIEFAILNSQQEHAPPIETRINALSLLVETWLKFPQKLEDSDQKVEQVLNILRRGSRDKSQNLCVTSLTFMFRLLEQFGQQKNQYAPVIYKTLALGLVENHSNQYLREFIMENFITIFDKIQSIPLSILIEPLVKQIQISENQTYFFNVFDFNFFQFLAQSQNLNIKNAIQLLDVLVKVYLNNIIFAQISLTSTLTIIQRNLENPTLQEFVIKFIKISLAMFYASEKKKKPKEKYMPMYNNKVMANSSYISQQEMEVEVINAQKRSLIVEIIKAIVNMKNDDLNEKIKPLVAHTNIQIKNFSKKNNKGMVSILNCYDNSADVIIEKYESEFYNSLLQSKKMKNELDTQSNNDQLYQAAGLVSKSLSNLDQSSIQNFKSPQQRILEKYNIGQQKNPHVKAAYDLSKKDFTKAELTKLALLRKPKANPIELKRLEDIKTNLQLKQDEQLKVQDQIQQKIEKQKKVLRKQLEKRSLEQGVGPMNKTDVDTNAFFPLDSRQKEVDKEKKHGLTDWDCVIIEEEEEIVKTMVDIAQKRYSKALKHLYTKYANLGYSIKDISTFDKYQNKSETINLAEITRMIRDHDFNSFVTHEQLHAVMKSVNVQIYKNKVETLYLNYEQFKEYMLQLAIFSYPSLNHLPPSFAYEEMMQHFRNSAQKKGQSTILWDEPETTAFADKEILRELNKNIQQNPDYVLPEGFKKYMDKKIQFEEKLPTQLLEQLSSDQQSQNYIMCFRLIEDLLKEKLGFSLTEPIGQVTKFNIVKPQINFIPKCYNPLTYLSEIVPREDILKKKFKDQQEDRQFLQYKEDKSQIKKRLVKIKHYRPLSFIMKKELLNFSIADKTIAEECAHVLDDIIKSVENKKNQVISFGKVENMLKEQTIKQKRQMLRKARKQELKRRKRHDKIKQTVDQILKDKREQIKNLRDPEFRKNIREQQRLERREKYKSFKQKQASKHNARIKRLKELKSKISTKKKLQRKMKLEKIKKHNEAFQEWNKTASQKKTLQIKKKEEKQMKEKEKIETIEKKNKNWKNYATQKLPGIIKRQKEEQELRNQNQQKIKEIMDNEKTKEIFNSTYQSIFKGLFDFYIKQVYTPLNFNMTRQTIPLQILLTLVKDFNICPSIFSPKQVILIYNTMCKYKKQEDEIESGLDYNEFCEFFVRICAKGYRVFAKIAKKIQQGNELNQTQLENIVDQNKSNVLDVSQNVSRLDINNQSAVNKNNVSNLDLSRYEQSGFNFDETLSKLDEEEKSTKQAYKSQFDEYKYIDDMNITLVDALVKYLGLTQNVDKQQIEKRLSELKERNLVKPSRIRVQDMNKMILEEDVKQQTDLDQSKLDQSKIIEE